jgi:glucose/arabinose dehydrogenase
MKRAVGILVVASAIVLFGCFHSICADDATPVLTGVKAFGDWHDDAPGVRRKITVADLPPPFATESAGNDPHIAPRPPGAELKVPPGLFASGLDHPREIRTAPNGDLFISESYKGRVRMLRAPAGATKPQHEEIFASGLTLPFGMAFWPPGPDPQFVYIADTDSVVRFPYRSGDLIARAPTETIVPSIPGGGRLRGGGHWTRDIVFSKDGSRMFVSVGSRTNDADNNGWDICPLRAAISESAEFA